MCFFPHPTPSSCFQFSLTLSNTVDAMFAVYEATSLELWSFFSYNAFDGASGPVGAVAVFYLSMVFYLVIFVQVHTLWYITLYIHYLAVVAPFLLLYIIAKYISGGDN